MEKISYTTRPKNKLEAKSRATRLKRFLEHNVGGRWRIQVWENLGWYYHVQSGTLSVSYNIASTDGSFMLMNSAHKLWVGCGDPRLTVHHPKTTTALIKAIRISIAELYELTRLSILDYNTNSKLKGFKAIEL